MSLFKGQNVRILIKEESSYGVVDANAVTYELPVSYENLDVSGSKDKENSTIIDGTRNMKKPFSSVIDVAGSLKVPLDVRNIGLWYKFLIGEPTITDNGGGSYTHAYSVKDTTEVASFTLQKIFSKGSTSVIYTYKGIKVNELAMTQGTSGELLIDVSLMGKNESNTDVILSNSPTKLALSEYHNCDAQIMVDGAAYAEGGEYALTASNNLDGDKYSINGCGERFDLPAGMFGVTGSLSFFFDETTLLDKALNDQSASISLKHTMGSFSIECTVNELDFSYKNPVVSGPGGILHSLDFIGYHSANAAGSSLIVSITNDVESYAVPVPSP